MSTRVGATGVSYIVRYRLGGRASRTVHGGCFRSRQDAEQLVETIRHQVAAVSITQRGGPDQDPRARTQLVYFARLGDLVKIGVSIAPTRRARSLNAELLHVEEGGRRRERELHDAFKQARVRGEWFRDDGQISRYLAKQAA